jgi:L-alanine-DL-glutamate epimerase-like enolase superfamily enzyme
MEINDLELYLAEIGRTESDQPVRTLLARVVTDSGLDGWGESEPAWRADELAGRRDALLSVLAGRSIFDVEELLGLEVLARPPLRSAIEMACWDLIGRAVGQPLSHLFGGSYRRRIPLAVRLDMARPGRVVQVARALAEQGFHTQVIGASGRADEDLETVRSVRQAVGERAELRFDGQQRYDLETARDLCAELEREEPRFCLDPLAVEELFPMASLARQTSIPLALWRSIGRPADVLAVARSGAAQFVLVDMDRVGGLVPARKSAAVAEAGGLDALLGGGHSLGPATAAMLQLAASTSVFTCCNECVYHQLRDHLLREPLEIVDGMMTVPQGAGLGVEVDRAKLERYQVG